jgi:sec-independent protein translocase protein TatC
MRSERETAASHPAGAKPDEFKMSLMEHLVELRTRLLRFTIAVLVLGFASLLYARELYGLLMLPVLRALPAEAAALIYTSAIEELNVLMKIGLYAGVFLSTPVLLWQVWGFVSPGLYASEKKLATPFIFFGSLAFLCGAVFCYEIILPQMFTFLLQKEDATAITRRLDVARLREGDALRYLRLGDVDHAGALARTAIGDLEAAGEGQTTEGAFGLSLLPKQSVDLHGRLEGLGRFIDSVQAVPGAELAPLRAAVAKRLEASAAWGTGSWAQAASLTDEGAQLASQAVRGRTDDLLAIWKVERLIGIGQARTESLNWTRPMLSMSEQLTLVLVLELAFGIIFELPLVMMLLGLVGLVNSKFLMKYQRHAFVLCLVAAAVVTPTGDAVNLSLLAGPMVLCYELGVVLVWLVERRRGKTPAAA